MIESMLTVIWPILPPIRIQDYYWLLTIDDRLSNTTHPCIHLITLQFKQSHLISSHPSPLPSLLFNLISSLPFTPNVNDYFQKYYCLTPIIAYKVDGDPHLQHPPRPARQDAECGSPGSRTDTQGTVQGWNLPALHSPHPQQPPGGRYQMANSEWVRTMAATFINFMFL